MLYLKSIDTKIFKIMNINLLTLKFNKHYGGFTLAETLITLGIIGVVAALTIPAVLSKLDKRDTYSKVLKATSLVTNTANFIRNDNGGSFSGLANSSLELANLFKPYMKVIEFCADATDSPNCYISNSDNLYNLHGGYIGGFTPYPYSGRPKIVTSDGIMYWFELLNSSCSGSNYTRNGINENCGGVTFDINGTKPPNTYGKDIFGININKINTLPSLFPNLCDPAQTSSDWNGVGCTSRAIQDGGIFYY